MSDPISFTVTTGALLAALLTIPVRRVQTALPLLVVVELALVVQAVLDVIGLARGHHPAEPGVHLAYLATSLAVLPVAATLAATEESRWSGPLLTTALIVTAVVVVRMQASWRA